MGWTCTCGCGQLTVAVDGPPTMQIICHCADCRAISGEAMTAGVFFPVDRAHIEGETKDTELIAGSGKPKRYARCRECDEFLFGEIGVLGGQIAVRPSSLTPAFDFAPLCHVWTSEKAADTVLPEGAVAFERAPSLRAIRRR